MIEDGQREIRLALPIRLHQEIATPYPIASHRPRHTMLQLSPDFKDQILLCAAGVHSLGLTHCHLSP